MKNLTVSSVGLAFVASVTALKNGFGNTPVMGFNTYNDVQCSPNTTYVQDTINSLAAKGFAGLGYRYFQIDCGWQGFDRLSNGSITYDSGPFSTGIRPLSDLAISKGFKWSMYTDQGVYACDTFTTNKRPGSLGYETQDAAMFKAWNTVYVKVDNCFIDGAANNAPKDPRTDFPSRFGAMSSALQKAGIPGMLVCQWGVPYQSPTGLQGPATWTPTLANSYRVSDDIATGWVNVQRIMNEAIHVNLKGLSGPGNFADMDLLEVGNSGMTFAEQQSHFAIWALFKSALMISTSVTHMSDATRSILTNKGLIRINQDSLGEPVKLVQRFTNDRDLFAGSLAGGDKAVLVLDQTNRARTLSVQFSNLGIDTANVEDLWTGKTAQAVSSYSASASAHGSMALRLSNIKKKQAASGGGKLVYTAFATGTLQGSANVQDCSGCSSGKRVGYIGSGGSVTINGIKAVKTSLDVYFDFINCEIGYLSGEGQNVRGASISVNGGAAQSVAFPLTGYNWDKDLIKGFKVRLSGFNVGQSNSINVRALSSLSQYAPDFDRVGVPSA